eukprot:SAG11_NODE_16086_length_557_cov_0.855895_1_plen_20_part_01
MLCKQEGSETIRNWEADGAH